MRPARYHRISCGCCTGDVELGHDRDRCVCWNHQDTPRGMPPHVCAYHAAPIWDALVRCRPEGALGLFDRELQYQVRGRTRFEAVADALLQCACDGYEPEYVKFCMPRDPSVLQPELPWPATDTQPTTMAAVFYTDHPLEEL